jgi:hypothetical protein
VAAHADGSAGVSGAGPSGPPGPPGPPGPLGEELAALLAAVHGWLESRVMGSAGAAGTPPGTGTTGRGRACGSECARGGGGPSGGEGPGGGPAAAGPAVCQLCPLCRLLAALGERPDLTAHLLAAAASLAGAWRSLFAGTSPAPAGADTDNGPGADDGAGFGDHGGHRSRVERLRVERIDVG